VKPIRVRRALFATAIATSAGAALACGPSFQAIYEGNVRFEHCYALEESAQTLVPEKVDCWRDWSEHYTYGQTRDRIHYATARYVALSQAANVPTDEAMMMAAPGMTPRQSSITAPAPTNAFAPPPKVLEDYPDASHRPLRPSEVPIVVGPSSASAGGGRGIPHAAPEPIALPAGDCSDRCGQTFKECKDGCATGDGGVAPKAAPESACAVCEKTYRGCMRGCFK
jgi:hypothetical protein